MLFLILLVAVGSVSAKNQNVFVALDADTLVSGVKEAMRSEYLKNLADDFAIKAALYMFKQLGKNKKIRTTTPEHKRVEQPRHSRHDIGREGPDTDTSSKSSQRHTRHLPLNVSLLSGSKTPIHNSSDYKAKPNNPEQVETDSTSEIPPKKEEELMNLLNEPSSDGDYPEREAELTDYESKKDVKPLRTVEMINGKRFRRVDIVYL